jgi:hypothetical protein
VAVASVDWWELRSGCGRRMALPALLEALEAPEPDLAQWAALALWRMGPAAASAVEALDRASESTDRVVATAASQALRRVQQ